MTQVAVEQFKQLGFKIDMSYVVRDSMYTKFCQVPGNQPDVCPSVGWLKDFADPETLLNPVFNGKNILDEANSNFALLDDPAINKRWTRPRWSTIPPSATRRGARSTRWSPRRRPPSRGCGTRSRCSAPTDVNGVVSRNLATWDLAFMSLK